MDKNFDYYMKLPYTMIVEFVADDTGDYYFSRVLELDGCMSHGDTREEAIINLWDAMEGWIETKLEMGHPIHEPAATDKASGKFTLRLPKSLHYKLTKEAEKEGVSLNQYALYKLSS